MQTAWPRRLKPLLEVLEELGYEPRVVLSEQCDLPFQRWAVHATAHGFAWRSIEVLLAMRFEDSRRWRLGTPSYELPVCFIQPPKAISSHSRKLLRAMRNLYAAKNEAALAKRSSRRRGEAPGALTHMVAANLRARALAPVIQELRAAGFVSYGDVAKEMNQRQVPRLRGGKRWYPMTVSRVLVRLAKQRL